MVVYTTIITQVEINMSYLIMSGIVAIILLGFSIYDWKTKRVPNKALALFIPVILFMTVLRYFNTQADIWLYIGHCALGSLIGGGLLLTSALISHGQGIGGGDIKLAALIGIYYGPYDMLFILFFATLFACVFGLIKRSITKSKDLQIAFVPFITMSACILMIIKGVFLI